MKRISVILLVAWSASLCHAQNIEWAWDMVWSRFYLPQVKTFGDCLSSSEKTTGHTHSLSATATVDSRFRAQSLQKLNPIPTVARMGL